MISKEVEEFLKKNNVDYEIKDEQIYIGGDLYLDSLTSIPEEFNPTVGVTCGLITNGSNLKIK